MNFSPRQERPQAIRFPPIYQNNYDQTKRSSSNNKSFDTPTFEAKKYSIQPAQLPLINKSSSGSYYSDSKPFQSKNKDNLADFNDLHDKSFRSEKNYQTSPYHSFDQSSSPRNQFETYTNQSPNPLINQLKSDQYQKNNHYSNSENSKNFPPEKQNEYVESEKKRSNSKQKQNSSKNNEFPPIYDASSPKIQTSPFFINNDKNINSFKKMDESSNFYNMPLNSNSSNVQQPMFSTHDKVNSSNLLRSPHPRLEDIANQYVNEVREHSFEKNKKSHKKESKNSSLKKSTSNDKKPKDENNEQIKKTKNKNLTAKIENFESQKKSQEKDILGDFFLSNIEQDKNFDSLPLSDSLLNLNNNSEKEMIDNLIGKRQNMENENSNKSSQSLYQPKDIEYSNDSIQIVEIYYKNEFSKTPNFECELTQNEKNESQNMSKNKLLENSEHLTKNRKKKKEESNHRNSDQNDDKNNSSFDQKSNEDLNKKVLFSEKSDKKNTQKDILKRGSVKSDSVSFVENNSKSSQNHEKDSFVSFSNLPSSNPIKQGFSIQHSLNINENNHLEKERIQSTGKERSTKNINRVEQNETNNSKLSEKEANKTNEEIHKTKNSYNLTPTRKLENIDENVEKESSSRRKIEQKIENNQFKTPSEKLKINTFEGINDNSITIRNLQSLSQDVTEKFSAKKREFEKVYSKIQIKLTVDQAVQSDPEIKPIVSSSANWEEISAFFGKIVNSKIEGLCRVLFKNGVTFSGNFLNGKREGMGQLTKSDGAIYSGIFKDDKPFGIFYKLEAQTKLFGYMYNDENFNECRLKDYGFFSIFGEIDSGEKFNGKGLLKCGDMEIECQLANDWIDFEKECSFLYKDDFQIYKGKLSLDSERVKGAILLNENKGIVYFNFKKKKMSFLK